MREKPMITSIYLTPADRRVLDAVAQHLQATRSGAVRLVMREVLTALKSQKAEEKSGRGASAERPVPEVS